MSAAVRRTPEPDEELLALLGRLFPESSKTTLRQMLEQGRVRVNGKIEKRARRALSAADVVDLGPRDPRRRLPDELSILHEDDDLIVVVKDEGLLTVATVTEREETAQALLNQYLGGGEEGRVHVVHRLDRATSGVLVFAKNFPTREALKESFAAHDIDRVYVAIVEGALRQPEGTIRSHLREGKDLKIRSVAPAPDTKLAVTHYRVLASRGDYTLVEVTLETGRRNQIRVHFSDSGHPVAGDAHYGAVSDPIGRLALHAKILGFVHPWSGEKLTFTAPVPDAFRKIFREAR
jgi:RluA family pseudouridine synthase